MRILPTLIILLCCKGISAQSNLDLSTAQKDLIPFRTISSSTASGFVSYQNFTRLSATNESVTASGNISYLVGDGFNIGANVSTPISTKNQSVKPLTLSGLSNGSSVDFTFQKISWGNGFKYDQTSYNKAIVACGKDINDFNYDDLNDEQRAVFDRVAKIDWGTSFYYGGKIGLEQQAFAYITDPVTYASSKSSKTALKISGTIGMLDNWGILALTFTHKAGYSSDDPVKYDIPVNSNGVQVEKTLSTKAPVKQNSEKLRLEFLSNGNSGSRLRINPNINVEFNQQLFSAELPVYFLTSDKERTAFNGGIYAGYVSDRDFKFNWSRDNIGFGVFVGASFSDLFK